MLNDKTYTGESLFVCSKTPFNLKTDIRCLYTLISTENNAVALQNC